MLSEGKLGRSRITLAERLNESTPRVVRLQPTRGPDLQMEPARDLEQWMRQRLGDPVVRDLSKLLVEPHVKVKPCLVVGDTALSELRRPRDLGEVIDLAVRGLQAGLFDDVVLQREPHIDELTRVILSQSDSVEKVL